MRILHTADWHIGRVLSEYSLLEDQKWMLDRLKEYLEQESIQVLLVAGDVYDRSMPSSEAVSLLDQALSAIVSMGVSVLAIGGNHDGAARLSFGNRLYRKSGLYIEGFPQKDFQKVVLSDEYGPVNFYLVPYFLPGEIRPFFPEREIHTFQDAFAALWEHNQAQIDWNARNVLLAHGFFTYLQEKRENQDWIFSDSEVSIGGSDLVDIRPAERFDYVALGHLHAPQKVGRDHLRYAGSLLKYSVSEASQRKSFSLVELGKKGQTAVSQIALPPLRDLRSIQGELEALLQANQETEDYLFVSLTDSGAVLDAMARLRESFPRILGLRLLEQENNRETALLSLEELEQGKKSPLELFSDFYESIKGEPLSAVRRKLMEDILLEMAGEDR